MRNRARHRSLRIVTAAPRSTLVIIGMWALVLIPMWLRRHDEAQETKSADRFARAMGTLRRSRPGASGSALPAARSLMPGRSAGVPRHPGGRHRPAGGRVARGRRAAGAAAACSRCSAACCWSRCPRRPARPAADRGSLPSPRCSSSASSSSPAARSRSPPSMRASPAERAPPSPRPPAPPRPATPRRARPSRRPCRRPRPDGDAARIVASAPLDARRRRRRPGRARGTRCPPRCPTYVTAPRATRMPRVLDLTHPGQWTGAVDGRAGARARWPPSPSADGEMRVETFEITVPRDPARACRRDCVEPATYADRYVASDDGDGRGRSPARTTLDTLLGDPRTGVELPAARCAAPPTADAAAGPLPGPAPSGC